MSREGMVSKKVPVDRGIFHTSPDREGNACNRSRVVNLFPLWFFASYIEDIDMLAHRPLRWQLRLMRSLSIRLLCSVSSSHSRPPNLEKL